VTVARDLAAHQALIAWMVGPDGPIGDPDPMPDLERAAFEAACGVALCRSLALLLAVDRGWTTRRSGWPGAPPFTVASASSVIGAFVGPFAEAFEDFCARRLPGRALPLDASSETLTFLYLGDPDEIGEYPVLQVGVDDVPELTVVAGGFDLWLAQAVGRAGPRAGGAQAKEANKRILGRAGALTVPTPRRVTPVVPGPPPGSVAHPAPARPSGPPRRLTDAQVAKGLREHATSGNTRRLGELVAMAQARGLGLDDALVDAALGGPISAVSLLLEAGASPNARDRYGTALARSVYNPDDAVHFALLAAGADPTGRSVLGKTALTEAVAKGQLARVRASLAAGADPNRPDTYGMTALHAAVSADPGSPVPPVEVLDALLSAGADARVGPCPLIYAITNAPATHALRLLEAGVDVHRRDAYLGRRPLHVAFEYGRDALAGPLIAAGADRCAVDDRGLVLDGVYGPDGADVRPVWFGPASGSAEVEVRLGVWVLNEHHARSARGPLHTLTWWRELGAAGVYGRVVLEVLEELDFSSLTAVGPAEVVGRVRLDAWDERFVAAMAWGMLGGVAFRGVARGMPAAARATSVCVAAPGVERRRVVLQEPMVSGALPARRGGVTGVLVTPTPGATVSSIQAALYQWEATRPLWGDRGTLSPRAPTQVDGGWWWPTALPGEDVPDDGLRLLAAVMAPHGSVSWGAPDRGPPARS
jgi:hypothetical protein